MKLLFLNQTFYPDVVATAQHLTDLAVILSERGHEVTVIVGDRSYQDPSVKYSKSELLGRVKIIRISYWAQNQTSKLRRIVNSLSFLLSLAVQLLFTQKQDITIGLSSPPFISALGVWFARLKGGRFIHWVMDMNPDEAVRAGWIHEGSLVHRMLDSVALGIYQKSGQIIVLDRYMKQKMVEKGIAENKIRTIPPWAHDNMIHPVSHQDNSFRKMNGLEGKFIVMYSGNHSICHPLDTLLMAALKYRSDPDILFNFIGGGARHEEVKQFKSKHHLNQIIQMPYQEISRLSDSLSAGDLHVVTMGNEYAGIVHPCKIYGILAVGKPFVLIGPKKCHIGDLIDRYRIGYHVEHGDVQGLTRIIEEVRRLNQQDLDAVQRKNRELMNNEYGQHGVCEQWINLLEMTAKSEKGSCNDLV